MFLSQIYFMFNFSSVDLFLSQQKNGKMFFYQNYLAVMSFGNSAP